MIYTELIDKANSLKSIMMSNSTNECTERFVNDIEVACNNRMTETVEGLEYLLKSRVYKLDIDDKMPNNLLEVRNNRLNDIFSVTVEADVNTIHYYICFQ